MLFARIGQSVLCRLACFYAVEIFSVQFLNVILNRFTYKKIILENFFKNFLSNLNNYTQLKDLDLIRDNLAETACKHAVKGGDDLDKEELVKLVRGVGDGTTTLQCPHGRPFVVKFSHRDVDKWFRRIV